MDAIEQSVAEQGVLHLYGMFSGGHDSLVACEIASRHPLFRGVVHLNTGIGIEQTRTFVRDTCAERGWELHEVMAGDGRYEELLFSRGGMPGGPKSHNSMLWYLKQQPHRRWHRSACEGRTGFVTGIRLNESHRRMGAKFAVPVRRWDRQVWVNPILDMDAIDVGRFLEKEGLARNPVVDLIHRSGECLCGALAKAQEIHEIRRWFPVEYERIRSLEIECGQRGLNARWGGRPKKVVSSSPLCHSCASE
jgi:3'-phosphoadenosine 5'-phosphosulfate sulfotransferase (PAPS reductase)/FAD synthetase